MFKIEKDVPRSIGRSSYPFREMEIGDSFEFDSGRATKVVAAAHAFAANNPPYKFSSRKQGSNKHRIWRIA